MKALLRLMLLPVQAPMLLLLFVVSTYLGMHWSRPITVEASELAAGEGEGVLATAVKV